MKFIVRFVLLIALCLTLPAFAGTQVDINSADAKTLAQSLDGVGLSKAEAIIAYRNAHGPFESLADLAKVKGIGPRIIEANRDAIVFGRPPAGGGTRGSPSRPLGSWW
jgi:competence protein ComEA